MVLFWKRKKNIYSWTRSRPTRTFGESNDQVQDKSESKYQRVQDKSKTIEKCLESGLRVLQPYMWHQWFNRTVMKLQEYLLSAKKTKIMTSFLHTKSILVLHHCWLHHCVTWSIWRVRKLSDFIKNIVICVSKTNKGLTGLEMGETSYWLFSLKNKIIYHHTYFLFTLLPTCTVKIVSCNTQFENTENRNSAGYREYLTGNQTEIKPADASGCLPAKKKLLINLSTCMRS